MCAYPRLNQISYTTSGDRGTIQRFRLLQRLEDHANCRLVLITGQAAQGKSTLAADYLKKQNTPTAWLHLDREDADPYKLCLHLLQAMQQKGRADADFSGSIHSAAIADSRSSNDLPSFKYIFSEAFASLEKPLHIVIDSLEKLPSDAPAFELIQEVVDSTPPGMKLFLISRHTPPLRLQALKVKQKAFFLNNSDMAFTQQEIADYFEKRHQLRLESIYLERLHSITGGWAGGLVLISQKLFHLSGGQIKDFIVNGLSENVREETNQFFKEIVFINEPEPIRKFLLQTAVLDVIEPEIACELTGRKDSPVILEELLKNNLFIEVFHDSKLGFLYCYNPLFKDFLRFYFLRRLSKKEQIQIYSKAGNSFCGRRRREEAVKYFLLAGDHDSACRAIKRVGVDFCIKGCFQQLKEWLGKIPGRRIESDPWLFLLLTLTRRYSGGKRSLKDFQIALKRFKKRNDLRGRLLALAYLIEAAVFHEPDLNLRRKWLKEAGELLKKTGGAPHYTYARTLLWLQIGFGYIFNGIDIPKGLAASQNALFLSAKMGDPELQAHAGMVSILGFTTSGDFSEAEIILARIRSLTGSRPYPEHVVFHDLIHSELCLRKGEIEKAGSLLESAREKIETYGFFFLYPEFLYAEGRLFIRQGRFDRASSTFRRLLDLSLMSGNVYHQGLARRMEADLFFSQKNFLRAKKSVSKAISSFEAMGGDTVHLIRARLIYGLANLDLRNFHEARAAFEKSLTFFKKNIHWLSMAETYLCLGLLHHAAGGSAECRKNMTKGFQIAERKQFRFFPILRLSDLKTAREITAANGENRCAEYAEKILSEPIASLKKSPLVNMLQTADSDGAVFFSENTEKVNIKQEVIIRRKRLQIRTFGGFQAELGDEGCIGAKRWCGRRTKLLLKAIVVNGGKDVPVDVLIDNLWPDSPERAARKNLKVTLHRLRKVLEPELEKGRGSAYVHQKSNRITLDRRLCRVDVDEFIQCCKESQRLEDSSDIAGRLDLCEKALALYLGDFLPEEPYEPWIEMKRVSLKDAYIETLYQIVDIYKRLGFLEKAARYCAKIIEAEPVLERANQELMRIHLIQGRKTEAIKVFDRFKRRLVEDIGMEPDPLTVKLARQIGAKE